jgi:hypothetical protein
MRHTRSRLSRLAIRSDIKGYLKGEMGLQGFPGAPNGNLLSRVDQKRVRRCILEGSVLRHGCGWVSSEGNRRDGLPVDEFLGKMGESNECYANW